MIHYWSSFWDLRSRQVWIHLTFALLLCAINGEVCRARSKISWKPNFNRSVAFIDQTCYLIKNDIVIIGHHLSFIGLYSLKAWLVPQFKSLLNFSLFFSQIDLAALPLSVLSCEPFLWAAYKHSLSFPLKSPGFAIFRNNSKPEISSDKASRILSESYHHSWS